MPDIKFATADVSAMKLGTTAITKVMYGAAEVWPGVVGPCNDVLAEPFDHLAAWTPSGTPSIVAGRTGNAVQIGGTDYVQYTIAGGVQAATLTIGFAYRRTDAVAGARDIFRLYSTGGATHEGSLRVDPATNTLTFTSGPSTVIASSSAGVVAANTWAYIEVQVRLADAPTGAVTVRVNGTNVIAAGGLDTKVATGTTYTTLRLTGVVASTVQQYDDLYLTTDVGCSFQGDHNVASTQAFKASLGNRAETVSGTTVAITTVAAIAVDDLVVVRVAADNLNASTPTFTCADSGGNTYTTHRQGALNATAAAGIAGAIMATRASNAVAAGGTITVTLSGAVAARVAYAESFTGYTNTTRFAPIGTTGASTAPASGLSSSVPAGDLILGTVAVETRTAPTGDADTTGGATWSTLVQIPNDPTGTDNTRVLISGQHKIASIAAIQQYNQTTVSTDWAASLVALQRA